jgi:hypothetical protein
LCVPFYEKTSWGLKSTQIAEVLRTSFPRMQADRRGGFETYSSF